MVKINSVFMYAIIGMSLLVFAFYSSTIMYADAISVVNVTSFPAGTVTVDATYRTDTGDTDTTAYVVGQNGGQAYVWKKSGSSNTITGNVTLTGSSTARAIEYNEDIIAVYVATNDKFWKLTTNIGIGASFATGTANLVRQMIYDETNNILYYCTLDTIGTLNQVTLSPTTVYTDAGTNGMFACALDETNNFMYIAGDALAGIGAEVIKVSLTTFTVVDSAQFAVNFGFGVCYDSVNNKVWATESSGAIVHKYDSDLNQETTVAVGTTPRNCSISDDTGARRLYVANEGTDNVSILDIDSNTVLSTQSVCDYSTTYLKIDTKRLFNTTNTYIPCGQSSTTNRVIIDDSVSEALPPSTFCDEPENENILRCRLEDAPPITGTSTLFNQSSTDLICQIGLVPCTQGEDGHFTANNPDTKTNGIGYLITVIAFGVVISIMWLASGGKLGDIPTFVWFIITLSILGVLVGFDFLDVTFLIIGIIAIIALAVAKVKGLFGSSGLFAGESL